MLFLFDPFGNEIVFKVFHNLESETGRGKREKFAPIETDWFITAECRLALSTAKRFLFSFFFLSPFNHLTTFCRLGKQQIYNFICIGYQCYTTIPISEKHDYFECVRKMCTFPMYKNDFQITLCIFVTVIVWFFFYITFSANRSRENTFSHSIITKSIKVFKMSVALDDIADNWRWFEIHMYDSSLVWFASSHSFAQLK